MTIVYNKTTQKETRRKLRKNMPLAEALLWSKLRGKGLIGCKFRRQYSIENYILDFYCPKQKLAIELDGESHYVEGALEYDTKRQEIIAAYGIRVLRFPNTDVYENIEGVLMRIMEYLK